MKKKIHIILIIAALAAAAAGLVIGFPDTAAEWAVYCSVLLSVALQPVYMALYGKNSRVYSVDISSVGIAYLLCQCAAAAVMLCVGTELLTAVVICAALALLAVAGLFYRKELVDRDPTGMLFVTQLSEMMDTISRATAERECGIHTQMLYEQARFCEPSTDSTLRVLEHRILREICTMKPTDSDDEIAGKCGAILQLLNERENVIHGNGRK